MFIVIGLGYYLTEDMVYTDEGKLLTNRTWNYTPPGAKDIPINFRIKFPENNPNPVGILRSKGIKIVIRQASDLSVTNFIF